MSVEELVGDIGYGGFAGFVIGFAVKRVLNVFLMLLGLYILSLLWLKSKGVIDIHWSAFLNMFKGMFEGFSSFIHGIVRQVAFSSAFLGGFYLGFKM
jgi:uncharacterized membrane protein (Fun14 family)